MLSVLGPSKWNKLLTKSLQKDSTKKSNNIKTFKYNFKKLYLAQLIVASIIVNELFFLSWSLLSDYVTDRFNSGFMFLKSLLLLTLLLLIFLSYSITKFGSNNISFIIFLTFGNCSAWGTTTEIRLFACLVSTLLKRVNFLL